MHGELNSFFFFLFCEVQFPKPYDTGLLRRGSLLGAVDFT